jgi:hypothetical protein
MTEQSIIDAGKEEDVMSESMNKSLSFDEIFEKFSDIYTSKVGEVREKYMNDPAFLKAKQNLENTNRAILDQNKKLVKFQKKFQQDSFG